MSSHGGGDILFKRSFWLGRRLKWSPHATTRADERGVPKFTRMPFHANIAEGHETSHGVVLLFQIYDNGVPYVIVGQAIMDTHCQEPVILVCTCYVENIRRTERQEKRKQRSQEREIQRSVRSRNQRIQHDRYEEDM